MICEGSSSNDYMRRAPEVSIHLGLLCLLAAACLLILRPFVPLIAWGIIIAIAAYPGYRRVQNLVGGSSRLAAVAVTVFLFVVLLVPVVLLTGSLVEGIQSLAARLKDGTHLIPPPPPRIETWPIIGPRVKDARELASKNLPVAFQTFAPQIKDIIPQWFLASV